MPEPIEDKDRALLLNFFVERDVYCPLCQYNLRNCTVTECPECGKPIRLAVVALDLSVAAWGFLTFMLALSAGLGVIFLVVVLREGWPPMGRPGERFTAMAFIGTIPLAIAALVLRRRFLRMNRDWQLIFAVAGTLVTIVLFAMFFANMMH